MSPKCIIPMGTVHSADAGWWLMGGTTRLCACPSPPPPHFPLRQAARTLNYKELSSAWQR